MKSISRIGTIEVSQVNPKGASMKGARNGLIVFRHLNDKKQMFFHDAHIGNGSALWSIRFAMVFMYSLSSANTSELSSS